MIVYEDIEVLYRLYQERLALANELVAHQEAIQRVHNRTADNAHQKRELMAKLQGEPFTLHVFQESGDIVQVLLPNGDFAQSRITRGVRF